MQLFSYAAILILATLFARNVLGDIYDSCGSSGNNCFAIPSPDSDVGTCLEQKVLYYKSYDCTSKTYIYDGRGNENLFCTTVYYSYLTKVFWEKRHLHLGWNKIKIWLK